MLHMHALIAPKQLGVVLSFNEQVLSEEAIEGGYGMRSPIAYGLSGIRGTTHSRTTDYRGYRAAAATSGSAKDYLAGDACSTILVRGSMPRTQLSCASAATLSPRYDALVHSEDRSSGAACSVLGCVLPHRACGNERLESAHLHR